MSYQFPVDPQDLFAERTAQFVSLGLPKHDIDQLRERVVDMWADSPGGWTYEWSRLASTHAGSGDPYRASLAYRGARFPCLAGKSKAVALRRQADQCTLAVGTSRGLTSGKVGHLGISFGGYFAARSGLCQLADAGVVIGGPVSKISFGADNARHLLYGMDNIFGNAVGFDEIPAIDQLTAASEASAMDGLLAAGDADVHVPAADVAIFQGRPDTEVRLIPGRTHCAMNKTGKLMPPVIGWVAAALHG